MMGCSITIFTTLMFGCLYYLGEWLFNNEPSILMTLQSPCPGKVNIFPLYQGRDKNTFLLPRHRNGLFAHI